MASEWLPPDVFVLTRLAYMIDQSERGKGGAALLGEIRQLEDRLGLSPVSRRRLEWSVAPLRAVERSASSSARHRLLLATDDEGPAPPRALRAVDLDLVV